MKIKGVPVSSNEVRGYICYQNEKKTSLLKINKNNKTQNNLSCDKFIKNICNEKKKMNNLIDKVKMDNFKVRLRLEDEKDKRIKEIKETCNKYKDKLSNCMGISEKLDNILTGNVDAVTNTMDFNEVSQHISNLEYSIIYGCKDSLKEYYSKGNDKNETFAKYMNDDSVMDIDKIMSSDTVDQEQKEQIGILETLKDEYKNLYDVIDEINKFVEESTENLKQLQENMAKNIEKTKQQNKMQINMEYNMKNTPGIKEK